MRVPLVEGERIASDVQVQRHLHRLSQELKLGAVFKFLRVEGNGRGWQTWEGNLPDIHKHIYIRMDFNKFNFERKICCRNFTLRLDIPCDVFGNKSGLSTN